MKNTTNEQMTRWETPAEEIVRLCKEIDGFLIKAGRDTLSLAIRVGELLTETTVTAEEADKRAVMNKIDGDLE